MRSRAVLLSLSAALFVLLTATTGQARGGAHPHFPDGGTLTWYHRLGEAGQAARSAGKVIFVEYGRYRCPSCRTVVSRVLPDPRVRERLSRAAVGLASDCDRPEPAVNRVLRSNLASARMLPFCGFLTPEGAWISGFAGHCSVDRFLVHLRKAETWLARHARPEPRPEPRPCPPCEPPPRKRTPQPTPPAPSDPVVARRPAPKPCPAPEATPEPAPTHYPAPRLAGSPDAGPAEGPPLPDLGTGGCAPPRVAAPVGPLPPPQIVINPPVRIARAPTTRHAPRAHPVARSAGPRRARTGDRTGATRRQAETAAKDESWGEVLRLTANATHDPVLVGLRRRAHAWAHQRLDRAVAAIAEGRFEAGLDEVKAVLLEMRGQPESVDAERGLGAIRTLLELQFLNPDGEVAKVVRQNAYDELRGTRWATLFRS